MAKTPKSTGYEFWAEALRSARHVVAPMVDQSELAWRMLSRRYGAQLCYTPMLHASVFRRDANYRRENLVSCPGDRPLIVQFCANDPEILLDAARYVEPLCDAVDLNLGCPQTIAKKGHYGAFLQDEWDLIGRMVGMLHRELALPVTCKIRVFSDIDKTVQYAKMLEAAGCQLLTVHGRTREQKGAHTGVASWDHIRAVKQNVSIPVFANGNIQFQRDVEKCLDETKVDGVMSAEGSLFNPALFTGEQPPCWRVVEEYLALVREFPCPLSYVRGHLFKLWFHVLDQPEYRFFREKLGRAKSVDSMAQLSREIKALLMERLTPEELTKDFSLNNIPFWRCQPYVRPSPVDADADKNKLSDSNGSEDVLQKTKRKLKERHHIATEPKRSRWILCDSCKANPKGLQCSYNLCKACCREKCSAEKLNCISHKLYCQINRSSSGGELNSHLFVAELPATDSSPACSS